MVCPCKANAGTNNPSLPYHLRLASGRVKDFATEVGVKGAHANNPGSVILPTGATPTPTAT
jgi:hypothetical protein